MQANSSPTPPAPPAVGAVLVTIALSVIAPMGAMSFVVPVFEKTFRDFGGELPWITRLVIVTSNAFRSHLLILMPVFVAFGALVAFKAHVLARTWKAIVFGGCLWLMVFALGLLVALYLPIFQLAEIAE